ncbi:MAG: hypothetical protein P9L89_01620 [Candidatus Celaenobacter polaris]|nr:hypothetical protein [Candidatus Celaenobacter polaris]
MSEKYKEIKEDENLKQKSTTYVVYIPEIGWVQDINVRDTSVSGNAILEVT